MFYISDATKKPTPNQESASVPFLLEFEPAHGLRYILRQFDTFYTICSDLELPTNNAITFFETLSKRLKGLSKPSQQECYQYSQLLFLHFCYRQYLFPFPSLCQSDTVHREVRRLLETPDQQTLHAELEHSCLKQTLSQAIQRQDLDVFQLYSERWQQQSLNEQCDKLLAKLKPLQATALEPHPLNFEQAKALLNFFTEYFMGTKRLTSTALRYNKYGSIGQCMLRFDFLTALHKLACNAEHVDDMTDAQIIDLVTQLQDLLSKNRERIAVDSILNEFCEVSDDLQSDKNGTPSYLSERMGNLKAKIYLLLSSCASQKPLPHKDFTKLLSLKDYNKLRPTLKQLLSAYQEDPLYQFFLKLQLFLESSPDLQTIAPAYVWRVFNQNQERIFRLCHGIFKKGDTNILDPYTVLSAIEDDVLSEEATSKEYFQHDILLYNGLGAYFQQQNTFYNAALTQHFFQRLSRTNIDTLSNRSVFDAISEPLENPKPIYRILTLLHQAAQSMADERTITVFLNQLFSDHMPASQTQPSGKVCTRIRKMNQKQLTAIAEAIFSSGQSGTLEARRQSLCQTLHTWFAQDDLLHAFVSQSSACRQQTERFALQTFLEKYAHELSRTLLSAYFPLFYTAEHAQVLNQVWARTFCEQPIDQRKKQTLDRGSIGMFAAKSRLFFAINPDLGHPPLNHPIFQTAAGLIILGASEDHLALCHHYFPNLPLFPEHILDTSYDWLAEFYQSVIPYGVSGLVLTLFADLFSQHWHGTADQELKKFCNKVQACFDFVGELRQKIGQHTPIIIRIVSRCANSPQTQDMLRVLCRWLWEDHAADALILDFDPGSDYIINELCNLLPIPVLLQKQSAYIPTSMEMPIWGLSLSPYPLF